MSINPLLARRIHQIALYYKSNPVAAFKPSPALEEFMEDDSTRILVRAANRIGKSVHAAVKLVKVMLEHPNRRYRVVGVDYQQAVGVISKLLFDYIPPDQLMPGCNYTITNGWSHQLIRLKNGSTCEIRSNDQKPLSHAGRSLHGIWCDEPPKPDIYLESVTRVMDTGGFLWITATPIGRPCGWLKDMVNDTNTTWTEHVVEFSYKNCPWYSEEQVNAWLLEAQAAPWAYRQKIFGDWEGETVNRIFSGFDEECQLKPEDELPEDDYWIGVGIDHGESVGRQVALICVWTTDTFIVWDEVVSETHTTPDMDATAILLKLKEHGWNISDVSRWFGDINSAGKAGAGLKVNDMLADALASQSGYRRKVINIEAPSKGHGSVEMGEKLLNISFLRGQLKVSTRCTNLTHALKHYAGEENLKHPIDALRYISQPTLEQWNTSITPVSRIRINR